MKAEDAAVEIVKGAPAVVGAAYAWITWNEAVAVVTVFYIIIQSAYLLRKWYREEKSAAAATTAFGETLK